MGILIWFCVYLICATIVYHVLMNVVNMKGYRDENSRFMILMLAIFCPFWGEIAVLVGGLCVLYKVLTSILSDNKETS